MLRVNAISSAAVNEIYIFGIIIYILALVSCYGSTLGLQRHMYTHPPLAVIPPLPHHWAVKRSYNYLLMLTAKGVLNMKSTPPHKSPSSKECLSLPVFLSWPSLPVLGPWVLGLDLILVGLASYRCTAFFEIIFTKIGRGWWQTQIVASKAIALLIYKLNNWPVTLEKAIMERKDLKLMIYDPERELGESGGNLPQLSIQNHDIVMADLQNTIRVPARFNGRRACSNFFFA